jgi:hypothetical protein
MAFLKRLAYYKGLAVGLVIVAAAGAVCLTYLFTGKFPIPKMGKEGTEMVLVLPEEIPVLIRDQMAKRRGTPPSIELS